MSGWLWLEVVAVLICLLGTVFFCLSEAALVASSQARLRSLLAGRGRRQEWEEMVMDWERARHALAVLCVAIDICILLAAAVTTHIVREGFQQPVFVVGAVSFGMVVFILVFLEIIPKSFGVQNAERMVIKMGPFIHVATLVLRLPVAAMSGVANGLLWLAGVRSKDGRNPLNREEIAEMLEMGGEEHVLEEEEVELAGSIIELENVMVREVMVPRPDVVALSAECSFDDALDVFIETGHSRVPLHDDGMDNIVGIVYSKDLLAQLSESGGNLMPRSITRPALFVPETKKVDDLLIEMRDRRVHIAIVVDEHGDTSGLVTLEDLLEEVVGELVDEHDHEAPPVRRVDETTYIVDARIDKRDLEDELGITLPEGEFDTAAGFVLSQLGRFPRYGERIETDQATFIVVAMQGRRIRRLRLVLKPETSDDPATLSSDS